MLHAKEFQADWSNHHQIANALVFSSLLTHRLIVLNEYQCITLVVSLFTLEQCSLRFVRPHLSCQMMILSFLHANMWPWKKISSILLTPVILSYLYLSLLLFWLLFCPLDCYFIQYWGSERQLRWRKPITCGAELHSCRQNLPVLPSHRVWAVIRTQTKPDLPADLKPILMHFAKQIGDRKHSNEAELKRNGILRHQWVCNIYKTTTQEAWSGPAADNWCQGTEALRGV